MCVVVCASLYKCLYKHLHVDICVIACAFPFLPMFLCMCNLNNQTRYLTANTCCIFGCLLPGRGKLRECHVYSRHFADFRAEMSCVCLSNSINIGFLDCQYARWMFVLLCVFVREQKRNGEAFLNTVSKYWSIPNTGQIL